MLQIIFKTAGHSWYLQGIGWSVTLIAEKNQAILIQYWWKELVSHEVYRCHRLAIIKSANTRDRGSVLVRASDCRPPDHRLDQWWLILYLTFRNKRKCFWVILWWCSFPKMCLKTSSVKRRIISNSTLKMLKNSQLHKSALWLKFKLSIVNKNILFVFCYMIYLILRQLLTAIARLHPYVALLFFDSNRIKASQHANRTCIIVELQPSKIYTYTDFL